MNHHPPRRAIQFLRWFCKEDFVEEIEGNLLEIYELRLDQKPKWSSIWFFWQVLLHFRPDFIKPNPIMDFFSSGLFKHHLLISYRSFLRNKRSFFINWIGLASGLTCVLLIYLWVADEWKYDRFHLQNDQLYRVLQNRTTSSGIKTRELTPILLAPALKEEVAGIEEAVAVSSPEESPRGVLKSEDKSIISQGIFASSAFFQLFNFPLINGTTEQVLQRKEGIVISRSLAENLFSSVSNVVGRTIEWNNQLFSVTGVFKDVTKYSSLQFEFVMTTARMVELDEYAGKWNGDYARTYIQLNKPDHTGKIEQTISPFLSNNEANRERSKLILQNYSDQYLYGQFEEGVQSGGRIAYVRLFTITALFILLIACFNFMNLSTAQAGLKMKEIGVKKTMGAQKKTLIGQFLIESLLMSFLSLILAIGLILIFVPYFNEITGKSVGLRDISLINVLAIIGIVGMTGLLAGSYPAFYLSRFQPKAVLSGDWSSATGGAWMRKGLVVLQFSLSVLFMVGVFVINGQLNYIQNKHLGFDRENVIQINRARYKGDYQTFLQEIKEVPGVLSVANMATPILAGGSGQSGYSWRGQEEDKKFLFKSPIISYNVIETLDMELLAGRAFSAEQGDDEQQVVINEAARQMMGLEDPIGMQIDYGDDTREIIGVVNDFHYGSIHLSVEPLIFRFYPRGSRAIVRLQAGKEKETLAALEEAYKEHHPPYPFNYRFLDEEYQRLHESETRVARLSTYFTGLAILISTLGILGLAMFMVEQKSKEIGVRKVLGASEWNIIQLMGSTFTGLIIFGVIIALPLSYWGAQRWLSQFAFHMDLQWWLFLLAALITIGIATLAIVIQIWKAVQLSPAACLRDE